MISELKKNIEQKMQKSVEALKTDLAKVRTGRAHTGLLDHVMVEYYGSMVPVNQVANITLIDVSALLQQVRRTAEQAALAIQAVFLFTLAAGLLVLVAAIRATADERLREGALLRALGARSRQLTLARSVEFGLLGAVAGAAAAIAAGLATAWLGRELFELPFTLDWGTTLLLALVTGTLVAGLGLWSTRRVVRVPPLLVLRAE